MSIRISTGEYTDVIVANHQDFKSINVVQSLNIDASAKTEEVRAFNDGGEPLVISTDMGQTTGAVSILKSSNSWFENIVMGSLWGDDLTNFSLKEAIKHRFAIFANYKDKLETTKIFSSMSAVGCVLNSDGTNEAVNGTLQSTYNVSATNKTTFPYAICVERELTASAGVITVLLHNIVGLVPGGKDDSGNDVPYVFDYTNATAYTPMLGTVTAFSGSAKTITCAGIVTGHKYIVAYLYVG